MGAGRTGAGQDDGGLLSGAPTPRRDITVPGGAGPEPGRTPERRAPSPPVDRPAAPGPPVQRVGRVQVGVGILLVLAAVAVAVWFGWRAVVGTPAALSVAGEPILDAEQVLADAEPALRTLAASDGAPLGEYAGCWFAPPAADATTDAPRVACGPVRLGAAADHQHWVLGDVSWSPTGSGGVTGQLQTLDETAELRPSLLRRPDGRPAPDRVPEIGTDGVRTEAGRLLTNAAALLERADADLFDVTEAVGASTTGSTRCYLGAQEVDRGGSTVRQSTGQLWCGPLLVQASAPGQAWSAFDVRASQGPDIVTAVADAVDLSGLRATQALPPGLVLYRPDAEQPEDGAAAALTPPDAAAQEPGFAALLPEVPGAPTLRTPDDGRLVIPPSCRSFWTVSAWSRR